LEPYLTFAGGGYGKGGFGGKRTASQASYQRIIRECHRIMKVMKPTITSLDWSETLKGLAKDDTVFLDPTYLDGKVPA
jgi:site-specific DNA-adenine methylase